MLFSVNFFFLSFKFRFYRNNKNLFRLFIFYKNKVFSLSVQKNLFIINIYNCLIFAGLISDRILFFSLLWKITVISKGLIKKYKAGFFLTGLGFRFLKITKVSMLLKLGLSHLIKVYLPYDIITFKPTKRPSKVLFFSSSKFFLSSVLSSIRLIKSPDNYKGKGFQVFGEVIKLKKREKFGSI